MDGLLFDTEALYLNSVRSVSASLGFTVSDELVHSTIGRNYTDSRILMKSALGPDFPYDELMAASKVWMKEQMAENGPPEKSGIRILFDFLQTKNIPIALATSTSEKTARHMIERAGLTRYFSAFAFGSEVKEGKPAPEIFLLARDRLGGFPSGDCAVFEDSPAGLKAAHAAGMKSVFVKDLIEPEQAVLNQVWKRIDSLETAASDSFFGIMQ